jgi:hypothetical protein
LITFVDPYLHIFGQSACAEKEHIKQMVFVNPTQLGKKPDRYASVLVFDKAFDDSEEFALG